MARIDIQQMDPLCLSKWDQDPIQVTFSHIGCSDKSDSNFLPYCKKRAQTSQEKGSGKGMESKNSRCLLTGITSASFY